MKKRNGGFTLAELMVVSVLFLLVSSSIMGVLILALSCWEKADASVAAQQNSRLAVSIITADLKQAVANQDPGHGTNPPTGYRAISPAVPPTGVLYPNMNQTSRAYIIFNEPYFSAYDPSGASWDPQDPSNYQKIKYYVSSGIILRQVTKYDSSSQIASTREDPIAAVNDGSITLTVDYLGPNLFNVKVSAVEKSNTSICSSKVYIPAR
ncbi:MAG: prepilin-type N-terminal cleavage/methylation domain-containing protein [bacterium]